MRFMPLGAVLLACAFPAGAGAADYCVDTTPACGTKNVGTFQEALNLSAATVETDRIYLGSATYTAPLASGFNYDQPGRAVEIIGSGRGGNEASIITGQPGGTGYVLHLIGGPGTSIRDVRIEQPPHAASSSTGLGTNGTAQRVVVSANPAEQQNVRVGVALLGGTIEDSVIGIGQTDTTGVLFDTGGGTVRTSSVVGAIGVVSSYGGVIERTRMNTTRYGVLAYRNQTTIQNTEIKAQGPNTTGVAAFVAPGSDTTVVADGVNLLGPGSSTAAGVVTNTFYAPASSAGVTLKNSILRGFGKNLEAASVGPGVASIAASYSDYDASTTGTIPGNATMAQTHISNVGDEGFAEPADGDYGLMPGSALIDAGDPGTTQGLDLLGNPLVTDGNLDGIARRDIGATELPEPPPGGPVGGGNQGSGGGEGQAPAGDAKPPLVSGFMSTKRAFAVGRAGTAVSASAHRTRFRYTLSEPAHVTIAIQRGVRRNGKVRYRTVARITRNAAEGRNSTLFTGRIGRRALRPGRYRAVATATDTAHNRSAPSRTRFRIVRR